MNGTIGCLFFLITVSVVLARYGTYYTTPKSYEFDDKYCEQCSGKKDERGVFWPNICVEDFEKGACPDGTEGSSYWYCIRDVDGQPKWYPDQPDRRDCKSHWIDPILEEASEEGDATT